MLIYLQVIDAPEDRDQFITLYETYRGLMFYVANQILQNEQDAEDAVHDAFLSVAEHIKKFSRLERHKTKAFLVTIVENKAIDLYRKKPIARKKFSGRRPRASPPPTNRRTG